MTRLPRVLLTTALTAALLVTPTQSSVAPVAAAGTPDLVVGKAMPGEVLLGEDIPVTLTVSNPTGDNGFNTTIRDTIPPDVTYVGGSATPDPVQFAEPDGSTTLVWENVFDSLAGTLEEFTYTIRPGATFDVFPPDNTVTNAAEVYTNTDPRVVPRADTDGVVGDFTGSDTATDTTTLVPFRITKSEPSPESELLRGVHDHQTVFSLTVENNGLNPSRNFEVVDFVPAGLEFLGCGTGDNSVTVTQEYTGSGAIPAFGPLPNGACVVPSSVTTVSTDPDAGGPLPAGVYTRVAWDSAAIAAARGSADLGTGASFVIDYVAAIPLFANELFPDPQPATQTANLDNNTGPLTTETPGEYGLTNVATVTGDYDNGSLTEFTDSDSETVIAEDIRLRKRTNPNTDTFVQGQNIVYELEIETSEYATSASNVVVTDVLPPILDFNSATPTPSAGPTPQPDGTLVVSWNLTDLTDPSDQSLITIDTTVRTTYRPDPPTVPVSSSDSATNTASLDADITAIIDSDAGTGLVPGLGDESQDTITAGGPTIRKDVSVQQATLDCGDGSGISFDPTSAGPYRPGDHVCFRLLVEFPTGLDTVQAEVFDVLPVGVSLDTAAPGGGWQLGALHDAGTPTFTDDAPILTWELPAVVGEGTTFEVIVQGVLDDATAVEDGDVLENLLKFRYRNNAGEVFQARDQANAVVAEPLLTLDKGVVELNGSPVGGAPADGVTVQESDVVTYQIEIDNATTEDTLSVSVRDTLPPGITCADVGDGTGGTDPISNGGACVDAADDYLQWDTDDGIDVAASTSETLTYDVVVPVGISAGASLVNTAGIRTYDGATNSGTPFTYVPADNIDTTLTPNTDAADDDSAIVTALPVIEKTRTTSINSGADGNNNGEATIGETISYTVTLDIPAGLSYYAAAVTDDIDADKDLVAGSVAATLDGGALPGGFVLDVDDTANSWAVDFPDPYVVAPGADQQLVVTFDAIVVDIAANVRDRNSRNRADFDFDDAVGINRNVNDAVGTRVVEPNIVLDKSNDDGDGVIAGGREVIFSLDVFNDDTDAEGDRTSTAYETVVVDTIPDELIVLDDTSPTASPVGDGGTVGPDGGVWDAGTRTISWTIATIQPGATSTLTYQARTIQPLIAGTTFTNTAIATTTSMPGVVTGERTADSPNGGPGSGYQDPAEDTLQARGFPLLKTVAPNDATVGETLTYRLEFEIAADVVAYDATIIDQIPPGLAFESLDAVTCLQLGGSCSPDITIGDVTAITNTPRTSGEDVAFFFDDFVPASPQPRVVVVRYSGTVVDVAAADDGASLTNTARAVWNDSDQLTSPPTAVPDEDDFDNAGNVGQATVDTFEPTLTIDKDVAGQVGDTDTRRARPGDVLAYSLEITNTGTWPAYDVTVTDVATDDTWAFADTTPPAPPLAIVNTDSDPVGGLEWTIDGPLDPGDTVTITYTLTVPPGFDSSDENPTGPEQDNVADIPSYFGVPVIDRLANPDRDYREYDDVTPDEVTIELDLASLGDRVWLDVDDDGVQDPGEPGIVGVGVDVTYLGADGLPGGGDDEAFPAVTGADGLYLVDQLPGGAYSVDVDDAALAATFGLVPSYDLDGGTASPNGVWNGPLAEDADRVDVDFGYTGTGSIGDLIWFDQDLDGVQDLGEDGIGGVDVTVTWFGPGGAPGGGDDVVVTTTTDVDGNYLVEHLPAGLYTVVVDTSDLPADYVNVSDPDGPSPVGDSESTLTLAPGADDLDQDFGYAGNGSIGDRIFLDVDKGGTQNPGDQGLTGVVVELVHFGPDGVPGGSDDSFFFTITGADGAYLFENLPLGNYEVTVVGGITIQIGDLTNSVDPDGPAPVGDSTSLVTLTVGNPDDLDQDFGYSAFSVLGDKAWLDLDGDGVLGPLEPGLAGVEVTIEGPGSVMFSTTTNADGDYIFPDIPDGAWTVTIDPSTLPPGVVPTYDFDGTGTPNTSATTLTTSDLDQDFGYRGAGTIGDLVWLDADADGAFGVGDLPLPGVTVTLEWAQPGGPPIQFVDTTDASGLYSFTDLPDGDYTVTVDTTTLPTGLSPTFDADGGDDSTSALTLDDTDGRTRLDQDFGYAGGGSIGDTVWFDRDRDGALGPTETGLPGVDMDLVWLDAPGGPQTFTTTTAADGTYLFENLPPGDYTVTVDTADLPAGISPTFDADGGDDSTSAVTLADGQDDLDQDFGYAGDGSIGDTIYLDLDSNGSQGPTEPGIPAQTVQLDWQFGLVSYSATTTTAADGTYLFDNLPPADYTVTVVGGIVGFTVNTDDPDTAAPGDSTSALTLGDGEDNVDQDFGYAPGLSPTDGNLIGDTVWYDVDGDGVDDGAASEPRLAGVELSVVWFGPDDIEGTADDVTYPTLTTGAAGDYLSAPLTDGSHSVTVTGGLPVGLDVFTFDADGGSPGPDGTSTVVDLGVGTVGPVVDLDQDFGVTGAGTIGDTVWLDLDRDGTLDADEPGIPGVSVTLTWAGPDDTLGTGDDTTLPVATTDADGRYLFVRLPAGTFRVDVAGLPADVSPTIDPDGGGDDTAVVVLAAGADDLDQDFGYAGTASVGDTVWLDVDGDGVLDPNEPGLAGITVTVVSPGVDGVSGTADDLVIVTQTDADGRYLVDGLPSGPTTVSYDPADAPSGIVPGSDLDGGNAASTSLVLAPGDDRRDVDFGLVGDAAITGTVWEDLDADGVIDPGEPGIPGVDVEVTYLGPDGPITITVTTDADGDWSLTSIPPGDWTTQVVLSTVPDGYAPTTATAGAVTIPVGGTGSVRNGFVPTGSIGDTVWVDMNRNGVLDPGELGAPGVRVILLDGSGDQVATTTTDTNGNYLFDGLLPGDYVVRIDRSTLPSGSTITTDTADAVPNGESAVSLSAGEDRDDVDFAVSAADLPATGSSSLAIVVFATLLILLGASMLAGRRRPTVRID